MGKIREILYKVQMLFRLAVMPLLQKRPAGQSGNVLLIYSGGLGDGVLDAQAIEKIACELRAKGKKISVLAIAPNYEVFRMLLPAQEVPLIPCSFLTGKWATAQKQKVYKETVAKLRKTNWEHLLVRFNRVDPKGLLLASAVPAVKKTAFLYAGMPSRKKGRLIYRLINHVFDETVGFPDDLTQMQLSREFAKKMGVEPYPIKIIHLPEQALQLDLPRPYITVTVDSSSPSKRWPGGNFVELIRRLLAEYPYDVVLTGINVAPDELAHYQDAFGTNDRVKNKIGKTTVKEWIEMIRGAQFHVGVDSSSIHVAAAVGTQAFCLVGVWDKKRFYPYQVEAAEPGTLEPICIYRSDVDIEKLPCANCNKHGGMGMGNEECLDSCKRGQPCLCLAKITVDDVLEAIGKAKCNGVTS